MGIRIETAYEVTDRGPAALSPKMDTMLTK
jgi:hypothetical protein